MVDMKEAPNIGNHFKTAHPPKIQFKKPCISKIIFYVKFKTTILLKH